MAEFLEPSGVVPDATDRATPTTVLVHAAAGGDQQAWNELVDRYAGLVWAIIRSYGLGAADAADASQTTWLRLVEHLDRIREPEHVGSWLVTSARRECLKLLRRAGRERPDDTVEDLLHAAGAMQPSPETVVLAAERRALVCDSVAALPDRCQRMLWALVEGAKPDYARVSTMLEIPLGSIGPTRSRCLERLRRELASRELTDLG
jgi:RNA polymerase sigma factor (sigma-70 family)